MSDEELRTAYARATAARRTADRAACPAPDALQAAVRREGPEERRLATLDHALGCAACREEFELLRAIEAGRRAEAGDAVRSIRPYRPLAIALAASLLVAVALGPGREWLGAPAGDVARGDRDGIAALLPADGSAMDAGAPLLFAWRPVPGAARYTLEVLTPDGIVRASAATTDTIATLDADALAPGDYRWMVRATTAAGERRSPARRLVLRGAPDA